MARECLSITATHEALLVGAGLHGTLGVATHEALPVGATGTSEEATQMGESYSEGQPEVRKQQLAKLIDTTRGVDGKTTTTPVGPRRQCVWWDVHSCLKAEALLLLMLSCAVRCHWQRHMFSLQFLGA